MYYTKVYRPLGSYRTEDVDTRHQVKVFTMKLDEKLSAQMHHQWAKHWFVLSASTREELANKAPLLIESKFGSYLRQYNIVLFNGWNRR